MSVFIKLVENRAPREYADERAADISYADTIEGDSEVHYQYDILPSGALRILRCRKGEETVVESVYAPGLWFRVEGLWHGSSE